MTTSRALGPTERTFALLDQVAPLNCVVVAYVIGGLQPATVRAALDSLQRRHPLLQVHIQDGHRPAYRGEETPPIPLSVMDRTSQGQWHEVLTSELDKRLPSATGPLARASLVHGQEASELLITFHHVIGDGRAATYLVRDLLLAAARHEQIGADDLPRVPARPALEDLLPGTVRGPGGAGRTIAMLARHTPELLRPSARLTPELDVKPADRRSLAIHATLSRAATDELVANCRRERVTVHSAVSSAALLAIAAELPAGQAGRLLSCLSAVDVRDRLDVGTDELGLYASRIVTRHRVPEGGRLWELARDVRSCTRKALRRDEPLLLMALQGRTVRRRPQGTDIARRSERFAPAAAVSNIGLVEIPTSYGPFALQRLHAAAGPHLLGAGVGVVTTTFRGRLAANLIAARPLVSPSRLARLADGLCGRLTDRDAWARSGP
jgi:hypothetical protein